MKNNKEEIFFFKNSAIRAIVNNNKLFFNLFDIYNLLDFKQQYKLPIIAGAKNIICLEKHNGRKIVLTEFVNIDGLAKLIQYSINNNYRNAIELESWLNELLTTLNIKIDIKLLNNKEQNWQKKAIQTSNKPKFIEIENEIFRLIKVG
jgi:hypothetical protein